MFENNFMTKLVSELSISESYELPLSQLDNELIKRQGLIMSISEKLNPDPGEVEIVQYGDGGLLRGLEGTVIRDWPEGSLCYCSITAGSANRLYTPAVAFEDRRFPIIGQLVDAPAAAMHVRIGSEYLDVIVISSVFADPARIRTVVSMDGGAAFGRAVTSDEGEEYLSHVIVRDGEDAFLLLVTRPVDGPGVIMYQHDLRRLVTSRYVFESAPGHLTATSVDSYSQVAFLDGSRAYFFSVTAQGVTYKGESEVTGEWVLDPSPLVAVQQNNMGSPILIDENLQVWTGSFQWDDSGERTGAELNPAWFVPDGLSAAHVIAPNSSSIYGISVDGVLFDGNGNTQQVDISGSVVGLGYRDGVIYIGGSDGLISTVRQTWGQPPFETGESFLASEPPHSLLATSEGLLYSSREIDDEAELYMVPYGGSKDGVFSDGYMPGSVLKGIFEAIDEIWEYIYK